MWSGFISLSFPRTRRTVFWFIWPILKLNTNYTSLKKLFPSLALLPTVLGSTLWTQLHLSFSSTPPASGAKHQYNGYSWYPGVKEGDGEKQSLGILSQGWWAGHSLASCRASLMLSQLLWANQVLPWHFLMGIPWYLCQGWTEDNRTVVEATLP